MRAFKIWAVVFGIVAIIGFAVAESEDDLRGVFAILLLGVVAVIAISHEERRRKEGNTVLWGRQHIRDERGHTVRRFEVRTPYRTPLIDRLGIGFTLIFLVLFTVVFIAKVTS